MAGDFGPNPDLQAVDLTKEKNVVDLMGASNSEHEWNYNCNRVKEANNGQYPDFWWEAIMVSGLAAKVQKTWK